MAKVDSLSSKQKCSQPPRTGNAINKNLFPFPPNCHIIHIHGHKWLDPILPNYKMTLSHFSPTEAFKHKLPHRSSTKSTNLSASTPVSSLPLATWRAHSCFWQTPCPPQRHWTACTYHPKPRSIVPAITLFRAS